MSFTIGIGAIIEGEQLNAVRNLELGAATETTNFSGLSQPPHVTVKRPFTVNSADDIEKAKAILSTIAESISPLEIQYEEFGNFGESTLFLAIKQNEALEELHTKLLTQLGEQFKAEAPFEGKEMVFHTSIATSLQPGQLEVVKNTSVPQSLTVPFTVRKVGIFLGLDNNKQWVVIFEKSLT